MTPWGGVGGHAGGMARFLRLLAHFTAVQALCCTFALSVVGLLALSRALPLEDWGLARYDFLLLGCLLVQGALVWTRFETPREALALLLFHALGFGLEAHRVALGAWAYPEEAVGKVLGVPLYAGFMYASVGSYVAQAWQRCELRLSGEPPLTWQVGLVGATYAHFLLSAGLEVRLGLTAALLLAHRRTRVGFTVGGERLAMSLPLSLTLIAAFVYLAENVATGLGAWVYPHQAGGWRPVHPSKWLAWALMLTPAVLIVARMRAGEGRAAKAGRYPIPHPPARRSGRSETP
ncbi:DUF817 family protein [Deinococcus murrayi]|uniref:DUF817 family protein n=1 Tax=Deinococcus murrayi TaxID=68910 RepID=UPI000AC62AFA|nr:DUF817 family protein [Deinococcus murrayi]